MNAMPQHATPTLDLEAENARFQEMTAQGVIAHAAEKLFPGQLCAVSSFGAEAVVLLHLISEVQPDLPIIFLNTGKLFGETLRYRDRLQERFGLMDVRAIGPAHSDLKTTDPNGTLWTQDTDSCCHIRKVIPQSRATRAFRALITGRKRFQTRERSRLNILELNTDGRYRLNPLANWSLEDLRMHIERHYLPRHPLVKDGFVSIGCLPCTSRIQDGDDYRAGRWAGSDKDECGIHLNVDGDGI